MCMKINRYFDLSSKVDKKADEKPQETLDDLLKLHDDVEIEFTFKNQVLDHLTQFADLIKDKPQESQKLSSLA